MRSTGIEPLSVFFSAVDALTVPGGSPVLPVVESDYSRWDCRWDFGDPDSGTWTTNGRGKNRSVGFTACHVYETPGTYTVTLTVIAPDGTERSYSDEIVVSAFTGTTFYVSATGDDSEDGLTPLTAWQTVAKVVANQAPDRRFLFKRGDTFPTAGNHSLTAVGRVIFGTYDAGAKPIIQVSGTDGGFLVVRSDYVFMDLEIVGPGNGPGNGDAIHFNVFNNVSRVLFLRLDIHDFSVGILWDTLTTTPQDENAVVGCEIYDCDTNGIFVGGRYLSIVGCYVHDMTVSHLIRVWQGNRCVLADNRLELPGTNRHCIKLNGPADGDGRLPTEFVEICGNIFVGKEWTLQIGPQNVGVDERVSQIIAENNFFSATPTLQVEFEIQCPDVTIRNNIAVGTGAHSGYGLAQLGETGPSNPPLRVNVFNNTVYRADASNQFTVLRIDGTSDADFVSVRNNFASAPLATTPAVVDGTCPNLTETHNLITDTPGFVDAAGDDFHLLPSSPAVGAGVVLAGARRDYDEVKRQLTGGTDLGAYKAS